jgi:putative ABC transport system substrate-binding protein
MDIEMMNFFKLLILLASLWVNTSFAQQNTILIVSTDGALQRYRQMATEFKSVLQKDNYQLTELNIKMDTDSEAESQLSQFIENEKPSFIYCIGAKAYLLAKDHTKDIPLLFSAAINWHRLAINDKTYGVANELSPEQELMILRDTFPSVKKIGLLFNNEMNHEYVQMIKQSAATLNIQIVEQSVDRAITKDEISAVLDDLLPTVDLFWIISDPVALDNKEFISQIFLSAKKHKKPVYAYSDVYIKYGAILAATADGATIGRQSANLITMLKNNRIPSERVQNPLGSEITLNLCTVEQLNIDINKYALDSVNKIVNCKDK